LSCKKNKLHPFYAHFAQGAQGAEATAIVAARLCGAAVSFVGHGYDAMTVPFELASNGDKDSGSVVVKEAMALKLPEITTYFMGCKEYITLSTGLQVPPKNPLKLAEAVT
jgi:hypothetical protein